MWIINYQNLMRFTFRILNEHWCIYSCLQIPPRENWFQYVRRVYAINFSCIITLGWIYFSFTYAYDETHHFFCRDTVVLQITEIRTKSLVYDTYRLCACIRILVWHINICINQFIQIIVKNGMKNDKQILSYPMTSQLNK